MACIPYADRLVTPRQTVGLLYEQLQCATKLLLEYKQNPAFRSALKTLDQAEETARALYTNEKVRLPLVLCTLSRVLSPVRTHGRAFPVFGGSVATVGEGFVSVTGPRQHTVGTYTDRCCACTVFYRRSRKSVELRWFVGTPRSRFGSGCSRACCSSHVDVPCYWTPLFRTAAALCHC